MLKFFCSGGLSKGYFAALVQWHLVPHHCLREECQRLGYFEGPDVLGITFFHGVEGVTESQTTALYFRFNINMLYVDK